MPSYRCSIELEVTADSPAEAAKIAQTIVDENVERFVWGVEEFEGPRTGAYVDVDLERLS